MGDPKQTNPVLPRVSPPKAREPWIWPFNHFQEEWPEVKRAKWSFFLCAIIFIVIGAFSIWGLYNTFVIPGKDEEIKSRDGTISQKDATLEGVREERDRNKTENEKLITESSHLRDEVATYRAAGAAKSSPLKIRAKTLATQLREFSDRWEGDGKTNAGRGRMLFNEEWQGRFSPRLKEIVGELDVLGQFSTKIGILESPEMSYSLNSPEPLKPTADELDRMADALPEIP